MANSNNASKTGTTQWTSTQAYVLAVVCLLMGVAVGYLLRGSAAPAAAPLAEGNMPAAMPAGMGTQPTAEQLKQMADKQAEPLLQQLPSRPNDPALLADVGNIYYDAHQFAQAIDYYNRSLKLQPANTNVRTDLGTAYWYLGDADNAISQFQTVLKTEPTKSNTLFNLGVVEWQGKGNAKAAAASWQKLLDTNPSYENIDKVRELLAQVKQHTNIKPGTKTDKPAM